MIALSLTEHLTNAMFVVCDFHPVQAVKSTSRVIEIVIPACVEKRSLKKKKKLNYHIRYMHMCLKCLICSVCGQGFYKERSHLAGHEEREGHKCVTCKKVFLSDRQLQSHSEFHTGKSSYTCMQCGELFSAESLLKAHNYTDKILYRCAVCCEELLSQDGVTSHTCTESKCHICGIQPSQLKSHLSSCYRFYLGQNNNFSPDTQGLNDFFEEMNPYVSNKQQSMKSENTSTSDDSYS